MQNLISYRALRALFIPAEQHFDHHHLAAAPKPANLLTQLMPVAQITAGIASSQAQQAPVYITVKRRIANLNTKDIFFGIFKTDATMNESILFEDVDNNLLRILQIEDILAIRRPD